MALETMTGTVTAVSGAACMVTVLDSDVPASIPLNTSDIQPGDTVVLAAFSQSWFVLAVMPRTA